MELYKDWRHYLQHKRVEKSYTLNEVAEKLNVSAVFYKKVELGLVRPSKSLFLRLMKILDLDEITCVVLIKKEMRKHEGQLLGTSNPLLIKEK